MDQADIIILALGGLFCFIVTLRLAWGPLPWFRSPSRNPMNSVFWNLYSEPPKPWVWRARLALTQLPPPHRYRGDLDGWSWKPVADHAVMALRVHIHSEDERHISGDIMSTPGTLHAACTARTDLRILDGRMTLTPQGRPSTTLLPGDGIVLSPGFTGTWQSDSAARLAFDIEF